MKKTLSKTYKIKKNCWKFKSQSDENVMLS